MRAAGPRSSDRTYATVAFSVPLLLVVLLHGSAGASYVGTTMLVFLVAKLAIARRSRTRALRAGRRGSGEPALPPLRVRVVMPVHNEDPALAVAGVRSLLRQTRPVDELVVVDDGSTDGGAAADAVEAVLRREGRRIRWAISRLPDNVGKRNALAVGFRARGHVDVFLCVDSDTVLDDDAVEHGLAPFADPDISAVAGFVTAMNWRRNLLTRLIDLRYVSAFLSERAAYSYFGSVLCCCGSLSFYRARPILDNVADFVDQRFLGQTATFGDDRRLTNYALRAGRVVLAERSHAQTAVPERLGHYLRQQVRWNKSFIRESTWVLGTFPLRHGAFWLTAIEAVGWIVVGALTLFGAIMLPFMGAAAEITGFMAVTALAALARNAAYLEGCRDDVTVRERVVVFFLAPLYGVLHLVFLLPIRIWALLTLRRTGWGTRGTVEVRLQRRFAPA